MGKKKKKAVEYPATEEQVFIIRKFLKDLKDLADECTVTLEELNKAMWEFYNEGMPEDNSTDPDDNYNFD